VFDTPAVITPIHLEQCPLKKKGIRMHNSITMRKRLQLLSVFIFDPANSAELVDSVAELDHQQFDCFLSLLDKHHVLIRALTPLQEIAASQGISRLAERARAALAAEHERIRVALQFLKAICDELEAADCPVVVIKTLEHWPDFGSDLDLFTTGDEGHVRDLIRKKFGARDTTRSWGDHLSHKRSFKLPGLDTPAEVHISRLGQAGEHVLLAKRMVTRRQPIFLNDWVFQVPAPEERVIVTSLERMYRHLYFRLCDILNLATLVQSGTLAFAELQEVAERSGIWAGVAACLKIVSDYLRAYGGTSLALPPQVDSAAQLGAEVLFERDGLWHFPVVPQGARLFALELGHAIRRGNVAASVRLSLLPPLASVASLAYAVTGNSGRIW
jgi:hypothetical protein